MSELILFDFDGISEHLPALAKEPHLVRVRRYLDGSDPWQASDHWEAVVETTVPYGITRELLDVALNGLGTI